MVITQEQFRLATQEFDSSLRLLICMFVPNFKAINCVTLILGPENCLKVWRKKTSQSKTAQARQKIFRTVWPSLHQEFPKFSNLRKFHSENYWKFSKNFAVEQVCSTKIFQQKF